MAAEKPSRICALDAATAVFTSPAPNQIFVAFAGLLKPDRPVLRAIGRSSMNEAHVLCGIRIEALRLAAWATYFRLIHNARPLRHAPRGLPGPRLTPPVKVQLKLIAGELQLAHDFSGAMRFTRSDSGRSFASSSDLPMQELLSEAELENGLRSQCWRPLPTGSR